MVRRGSPGAFEVLVSRYQGRLLAFCRHLLGSREDAEDVLQEVLAAAFNAILADQRPINVRPWLYRIARNRCLNHLRRIQAVGVDSMDIHLSDHGASTADKVHGREAFRMLVDDIHKLPETQRTALVLREMDALSYEQIAEAMETTVSSVKSLLVRARVSLAEAAEARLLSCEDVRVELGEIAEGLVKKSGPLVRRHLRSCKRCSVFNTQLKRTNKALTAVLPIGPLALLRKLAIAHIGHSAGAGAGSSASGAGAAGQAAAIGSGQAAAIGSSAAAGSTAMLGSGAGSIVSVSIGTFATKAAAGLAAAALVTAGAVEVNNVPRRHTASVAPVSISSGGVSAADTYTAAQAVASRAERPAPSATKRTRKHKLNATKKAAAVGASGVLAGKHNHVGSTLKPTLAAGRTQTQTVGAVLPTTSTTSGAPPTTNNTPPTTGTSTTPTSPTTTTTPATTTTPTTPTTTTTGPSTTPITTSTPAPTPTGSTIGGAGRPDRDDRGLHRRHHGRHAERGR
jgi:RNA polymerase sigma factor (sigma-70 family)